MISKLHLEGIHLPADWIGRCFAKTQGDVTSLYVSRASESEPVCIASGGPLNGDVIRALAVALSDAWRTGRGLAPKPDPEPYEVPFGTEVPMRRQSAQRLLLNTFGAAPIVTFMQHASNVARETDPLLKDLVWQRGRRGYAVEYRLLDQAGNVVAADVESNKALRAARAARLADVDSWCMPLEDFELASLAIPVIRGNGVKESRMQVVEGTQAPAGAQDLSALRTELGRIYDRAAVGKDGLELAPRGEWIASSVTQLLNRALNCDLRTFQMPGAKAMIFFHSDNPRLTPHSVRSMVHSDLVVAACERGEHVPNEVIADLRARNPGIELPVDASAHARETFSRPSVH
ncbi:hypothetical protein K2O51_31455 (plasmid) [Cupriavidus pinatubonensis]|uniref:hypothetical protein n=1 Tax=Cupriavidus pinatubonensis TaxID=248026 RepID=UPI001C73919F|nr:hypothetical protein [Cupriavidus pinatubonensis]QYY33550.1 hypothetical protein K2O51_31455 [Cupriavidus pinatubonensis]